MEIFAAVSAFIGLTTLLYNIWSGTQEAQENELQSKNATDLAKKNLEQNEKIANQNFELSKEQFDYQKHLNELTMQREDTAFQRQVADLKAAGLSPLNISGGSPATALTSANAPQFDMSGINEAFKGLIGSYNDAFNRRLQSRQFALQNRVSSAQMYTQLAESYRDQKQAQLEYKYLDEKLKWEKTHGFRDVDWKSDLTQAIEAALNHSNNSIIPGIDRDSISAAREKVAENVDNFLDKAAYSDEENFRDYGSVSKYTKYGHNFDSENYDTSRSSYNTIKEEGLEKVYKTALRVKDSDKNRSKLYDTDDYLKKHISKENWLKMSNSFVKYYLKHGMFEDHKKYFD